MSSKAKMHSSQRKVDVRLSLLTITSSNALIECLLAIVVALGSVCLEFSVLQGGVFVLGGKSWFCESDGRSLVAPQATDLTGRKCHYCTRMASRA